MPTADAIHVLKLTPDDRNDVPAAVKRQFRKLALEHHPDKGGDAVKFKRLVRAKQAVLASPVYAATMLAPVKKLTKDNVGQVWFETMFGKEGVR
jgi:hypothetical protein